MLCFVMHLAMHVDLSVHVLAGLHMRVVLGLDLHCWPISLIALAFR